MKPFLLKDFHPLEQSVLTELSSLVSRVLVTGGGGFLGSAICRRLTAAGIEVQSYSRNFYAELDILGVRQFQGNLTDADALLSACEGCQLVFHVAAKAGVWGQRQDYFDVNLTGTSNVIAACQLSGIHTLVYTSTPSVTFSGQDENGINEQAPYAEKCLNDYAHSKMQAEQLLLKSQDVLVSGGLGLNVVALRPHLIWGPNDPHLVSRILQRGRSGKLRLLGKQNKLVDTTYIDNAAYAHLLAAARLLKNPQDVAGKAYFISNDEPLPMANIINSILACADIAPVTKSISPQLGYYLGSALEWGYRLLNIENEPPMTAFVARQLSCSHYYDISAAKSDLGFKPIVTITEGLERLKRSLSN